MTNLKFLVVLLLSLQIFANTKVLMKTTKGDIELELFDSKAPITVKNFLAYAKEGFYNGTIFHRVIDNFMIQGGGFDVNLKQKDTKAPIKNGATNGVSNQNGTIAMARTNIVDSATAQFFINVKDNTFLDNSGTSPAQYGYAVFGKVTKGMSVINAIKKVQTARNGGMGDVPVQNIIINSVTEIK